jgi:hypothetical protein
MDAGEFEHGMRFDESDVDDFIDISVRALLGELKDDTIKILDYNDNPIEVPQGTFSKFTREELTDILADRYGDYLSDLEEGDGVIMSTYFDDEEI